MQTVTITAIDSVGNRSQPQTLDLIIDNVAPTLNVLSTVTQMTLPISSVTPSTSNNEPNNEPNTEGGTYQLYLPVMQVSPVSGTINGTVTDGGQLADLTIIIRDPSGQSTTQPLTATNTHWHHNLQPSRTGIYHLWIRATDAAGNSTQRGPYAGEVVE